MAELAESANQSRSRLSHTVSRLERSRLVRRDSCPDDRRGVFAVLTDEGFIRLGQAAHTHVRGVREHLVDLVSSEDLVVVGQVMGVVAGKLGPPYPA